MRLVRQDFFVNKSYQISLNLLRHFTISFEIFRNLLVRHLFRVQQPESGTYESKSQSIWRQQAETLVSFAQINTSFLLQHHSQAIANEDESRHGMRRHRKNNQMRSALKKFFALALVSPEVIDEILSKRFDEKLSSSRLLHHRMCEKTRWMCRATSLRCYRSSRKSLKSPNAAEWSHRQKSRRIFKFVNSIVGQDPEK